MNTTIHAGLTTTVAASPICAGGTTSTIPGFAYPGGKKRIRNTVVGFMPKSGGTYAEPFAGRAACFWKAATTSQFSNWWLNDTRTAEFFHALMSHGNTIDVPEHTREQFERYKLAHESGDPAATLLIPYLTYNGAGFSAGYRSANGSPTKAGYERTLRAAHHIMIQTQATVTAYDWKEVHSSRGAADFAFYDPPYIGATVHGYGPQDIDHAELIDALRDAPYSWILSEYLHETYVDAFGKPFWQKQVQLCSTNFLDDGGTGRRVECLWRNY